MLHHCDSTSNSALILASSSGLSIISMQVIARALAMSKVYFWAFGSPAEKNKHFTVIITLFMVIYIYIYPELQL